MVTLKTIDELQTQIKNGPVIALFSAEWCPDCRIIEPELPEIEKQFSDYTFIMIDRDEFIEVCQEYDIYGIPSFIAFHNGEEAGRFVSKDRKTKEEIVAFINNLNTSMQQ